MGKNENFSLRSRESKDGCPVPSFLFNVVLEALARERNERHQK
jgi:hypothetical protein